jgi:hypothetical protein
MPKVTSRPGASSTSAAAWRIASWNFAAGVIT